MQLTRVFTFFSTVFCILSISRICHADASLPPILNSYPKCDYQLLGQAEASDKTIALEDDVEVTKQALLDNAMVKIRQQAAVKGADAVILTKVQGVLSNSQSLRTLRHSGYEVKYSIAAELISLCQEDSSLPTVYTPYNSSGIAQSRMQQPTVTANMQFEIAIQVKASGSGNELQPLVNTVSLQQGFYGASTGMTTAQIRAVFGKPDAELALKKNYTAWVYGREHQVIFAGDTAVAFSQNSSLLSAEIKKRMVENLRFQQHEWRLDDTFSRRATLAEITAFYQAKLLPLDQHRFALQDDQHQLILQFAPYLDVKNSTNPLLLVAVSLSSRQFAADNIQLQLPGPDLLQTLNNKLANLATSAAAGTFALPQTAFSNRIQLADGQQLSVLTPTLALSYRDDRITGLTITNIVNDYAIKAIQQQLAFLDLPTTRADFTTRFADAFDSLNQLTLYGDHSEIKATYNNDELIDSLHIGWY